MTPSPMEKEIGGNRVTVHATGYAANCKRRLQSGCWHSSRPRLAHVFYSIDHFLLQAQKGFTTVIRAATAS
jgi:hypothetical protein